MIYPFTFSLIIKDQPFISTVVIDTRYIHEIEYIKEKFIQLQLLLQDNIRENLK